MFKNFASALALLAIGAYASNEEKPNAGGELYSKATYKYGRFVASMKASQALGTATAFALYDNESFTNDPDVFSNWNAMAIVPSLAHNEETSAFYSRMNKELKEEWAPYMDFTLDDNYHKFEIEWTPKHLVYKLDNKVVRTKEGVEALDRGLNLVMSTSVLDEDGAGAGWDDTEAPYYTDVDYVEVYGYDTGKEDFELIFRDDFDTYDINRWASSDNKTWEGKDSTLKKENAYVSDGRLFLKLDKNADYHSDDGDQHGDDGDQHGDDGDQHGDDGDQHGDDDEQSGDDSHDDEDFHVLPAPKDGTLDAAIEKATRVGVVMVRQYLDHFSSSMSHHLQ